MDAMLVVDMQVGLRNGAPKHDLHGVVDRINRLTAMVRGRSGKVIWIRHCGGAGDDFEPNTPGWAFLPELSHQPADAVVPKTLNDPFAGTDLQAILQRIAPDRVLVAGWATDFCVDATVRSAVSDNHRCGRRRRRAYLERSAASGCRHRHSPPQLGLEQPDHPPLHPGCELERIAPRGGGRDLSPLGARSPKPPLSSRTPRPFRPRSCQVLLMETPPSTSSAVPVVKVEASDAR